MQFLLQYLLFTSANLNYSDSFFESISGITTTGATVISNLDDLHHGILIWRVYYNGLEELE